jgi:hypothetical protein
MTLQINMKKICLIGGGTGGHLFPAISTAQELERQNIKTFLITDQRCAKYLPSHMLIKTFVLKLGSMNMGIVQKFLTLSNMGIATLTSIKILLQEKPSLVVGFGGYPTVPPLLGRQALKNWSHRHPPPPQGTGTGTETAQVRRLVSLAQCALLFTSDAQRSPCFGRRRRVRGCWSGATAGTP